MLHIYGNYMEATKIYKPEILICPKCNSNLKYVYAISNKVVNFSSGKQIRIKNLGYKCPNCNDIVYFSQTANKLAFKGYKYSAKVICNIDYLKNKHKSREVICDILNSKGIDISDRNIDILYNKFKEYLHIPHEKIFEAYDNMLKTYNEIRLSIDLITINEIIYILFYDFFTGDILSIFKFNGMNDPTLKDTLSRYLNKELKITVIFSVRSYVSKLVSILKELVSDDVKFYSFLKF